MSATALIPTPSMSIRKRRIGRMSLYALSDELTCLLDTADMVEEGTEERAELDLAIARFQAALPQKVDQVGYMLAHLESQIGLASAEIKRVQARKQAFERALEQLEGYCVHVIEKQPAPKRGARKLEGETCTLSIRPSDSTLIENEETVPIDYKTVAIEMPARVWASIAAQFPQLAGILHEAKDVLRYAVKVRVADVRKALKAGIAVTGADLRFSNNLVRK